MLAKILAQKYFDENPLYCIALTVAEVVQWSHISVTDRNLQ